ncbi:Uncharacterised protein [Zhongshania aliphaticivorans]|uniref:Dephospho-CoA kinase n=1 Tax=Zhongshania aliphaticivorans TaxID=1470434 RepID=A0A5S9NR42_9GAMM|nr:GrpB family protein [Zhongshania aliphaticivorans]CAA0092931.1 Uncharacterised protein [Zhongshania aliphaticivorans]CAA0110588.1 Uncharacterised protein [Zhongshania aliphaticivorans]
MTEITIDKYDEHWPQLFQEERDVILSAVAIPFYAIHHIGSTSVSGLSAKPVIDILIEVDDLETMDSENDCFASLGYECMGEYGLSRRRFYRKGHPRPSHHIHVFETGSIGARRHLAFRDYIRAHPDIAVEYESLKKSAAATSNGDINNYCEGKDAFVSKHQTLALIWWQNEGRAVNC